MGKLFPPFKVDIAGALCVPFTLRDARNRYQHGQISLSALRAIENKEICKLMERLKLEGIEVVTDGGFRSYDFLEGLPTAIGDWWKSTKSVLTDLYIR